MTQSPEYGSYIQNKVVYDDSRYFDQITGDAIYPPQDGFLNGIIPEPTVVPEGTYFLRYGNSSGSFLGGVTDTFESRSLPPFTDTNNYHYYRLSEDCEFSVGKIEPWFGQKGLGDQYVIYAYDEYGNILKDSSGNYIRYSVDYMLNNNILEDITEKVMKGEIIIE